ncbi:MAG: helix-turn-helix domain-containing protein [Solirubrobacteraceae bacterium]
MTSDAVRKPPAGGRSEARVGAVSEYLTVSEVAELLRCEHRTVRRAIRARELKAAMIGGRWLIRRDAVDDWFDRQAKTPAERGTVPTPRRARATRSLSSQQPGSVARLRAIEREAT